MRVAIYATAPPTLAPGSSTPKLPVLATLTRSPVTASTSAATDSGSLSPESAFKVADTTNTAATGVSGGDIELQGIEWANMANGKVVTVLGWGIWLFITGLNVYLIVMLILGKG